MKNTAPPDRLADMIQAEDVLNRFADACIAVSMYTPEDFSPHNRPAVLHYMSEPGPNMTQPVLASVFIALVLNNTFSPDEATDAFQKFETEARSLGTCKPPEWIWSVDDSLPRARKLLMCGTRPEADFMTSIAHLLAYGSVRDDGNALFPHQTVAAVKQVVFAIERFVPYPLPQRMYSRIPEELDPWLISQPQ